MTAKSVSFFRCSALRRDLVLITICVATFAVRAAAAPPQGDYLDLWKPQGGVYFIMVRSA